MRFIILFVFIFLLGNCSARNVILLGDSITMDMQQLNFNMFSYNDNVKNYAKSAFSIELVKLIVDPERNWERLNEALTENQHTSVFSAFQIVIPNIRNHTPDIVSIMVGLRNIFDGVNLESVPIHIEEYKLLLNKLEELLPSHTIVLINELVSVDHNSYNNYFRNQLNSVIKEFNRQLKQEVGNRVKLDYRFVELYDLFIKNERANPDLFLHQNGMLLHPNLQGYTVWKNKVEEVLSRQNLPVLYIKTNHWDNKEHKNFFQLFINGEYVNSFFETEALVKEYQLSTNIRKIEVIMSTW